MKLSSDDFKVYENLLFSKIKQLKNKAKAALESGDKEKADEVIFTLYNLMIVHEFAERVLQFNNVSEDIIEKLLDGKIVKATSAYKELNKCDLKTARKEIEEIYTNLQNNPTHYDHLFGKHKHIYSNKISNKSVYDTMFEMVENESKKRKPL